MINEHRLIFEYLLKDLNNSLSEQKALLTDAQKGQPFLKGNHSSSKKSSNNSSKNSSNIIFLLRDCTNDNILSLQTSRESFDFNIKNLFKSCCPCNKNPSSSLVISNEDSESNPIDQNFSENSSTQFLSYSVNKKCDGFSIIPGYIPALIDGAGSLGISLSELITAITAIFPKTNTRHFMHNALLPALVIPFFAILPESLAAGSKNNKLIKEIKNYYQTNGLLNKKTLKKLGQFLYQHPLETTLVTIAACTKAVIVFSNLTYIANQFNFVMHESYFFAPSLIITINSAFEYLIFNLPKLIELIHQSENSIPHSSLGIRTFSFMLSLINTLAIGGALGMGECYQLTQGIFRAFDEQDLADRVAWLPALSMGLIYAICHYALIGRPFNYMLQVKLSSLQNNISNLTWKNTKVNFKLLLNHISNSLTQKPSQIFIFKNFSRQKAVEKLLTIKNLILILASSLSSGFISFGALSELIYIFINNNSPPTLLDMHKDAEANFTLPRNALIIAGSISIINFFQNYLTDNIHAQASKNKSSQATDHQLKNIISDGNTSKKEIYSASCYSLKNLMRDLSAAIFISFSKFSLDWYYMPDSVTPQESTHINNLWAAFLVGVLGAAYYVLKSRMKIGPAYEKSTEEHQRKDLYIQQLHQQIQQLNSELQQLKAQPSSASENNQEVIEISLCNNPVSLIINSNNMPANNNLRNMQTNYPYISGNNEAIYSPIRASSNVRFFIKLMLFLITGTSLTFLSQYLFRNMIFTYKDEAEEMDRLNNSQIIGAIMGGFGGVFLVPSGENLLDRLGFFKRSATSPQTEQTLIQRFPAGNAPVQQRFSNT